MNTTFNKKLIARNIALALAIGVVTVGCAGNAAKQTQTSQADETAVKQTVITAQAEPTLENQDVVTAAKTEANIETDTTSPVIS